MEDPPFFPSEDHIKSSWQHEGDPIGTNGANETEDRTDVCDEYGQNYYKGVKEEGKGVILGLGHWFFVTRGFFGRE